HSELTVAVGQAISDGAFLLSCAQVTQFFFIHTYWSFLQFDLEQVIPVGMDCLRIDKSVVIFRTMLLILKEALSEPEFGEERDI
ncbi:MAG: hypothetical protein OEY31_01645, partial [Candidatus Bathyarchaeota archaeon]|nr:hypothetical protein [Candidatus Bathyarchaeota archaeon]